ncbi:MAG TPA: peptide ABC transporter substrate-binding protein [Aliidongia sp.]|nr:peptide ABC transporter substrate-binding protein [Aliidongia sp.]
MSAFIRLIFVSVGLLTCFVISDGQAAPPGGSIVRLPMRADPSSLDPHKIPNDYLVLNLFEGLTTMSATDEIVPGMAERWETSADGLVWTFHLRDADWSDGRPVTADDFVYSFRRVLDPATASPYVTALAPIVHADDISSGREKDLTKLGVEAPDPHTLRFTLRHPTPWFPTLMAIQTSMPVPRHAIDKWGDHWTSAEHIVVNGPFTLKQWVPLGELDFVRNPYFHDAASVKVDEVDHILADDPAAALKRYEAGELDEALIVGQDLARILRERPAELLSSPELSSIMVGINMKGPLGGDVRIREALSMTIDRDTLENKVIRLGQIPAYGLIPPSMPGYTPPRPDWIDLPMAERIARAKKLMAEAGAPTPLKVHLLSSNADSNKLYLDTIAAMWRSALGVETEIETGEERVLDDRVIHRDFEAALGNWGADYPDPTAFLEIFQSSAIFNFGNYANPKYDALLDQAGVTADPGERMMLLENAEALMLADQPIIPINFAVSHILVSPRLHGIEPAPLERHPDRYLWLEDSRG